MSGMNLAILSVLADVPIPTAVNTSLFNIWTGVIALLWYVLVALAMWLVFAKAGWPGILALIPIVNIVILVLVLHGLSTSFGHGAGFTVGLFFLSIIFLYILGYDSKPYRGVTGGEPIGGYAIA